MALFDKTNPPPLAAGSMLQHILLWLPPAGVRRDSSGPLSLLCRDGDLGMVIATVLNRHMRCDAPFFALRFPDIGPVHHERMTPTRPLTHRALFIHTFAPLASSRFTSSYFGHIPLARIGPISYIRH